MHIPAYLSQIHSHFIVFLFFLFLLFALFCHMHVLQFGPSFLNMMRRSISLEDAPQWRAQKRVNSAPPAIRPLCIGHGHWARGSARSGGDMFPVYYEVSGEFLMNIPISFTHRVRDVERGIMVLEKLHTKLVSPIPRQSSDHVVTLLRSQNLHELRIVATGRRGE